jgi:hypothetical protein
MAGNQQERSGFDRLVIDGGPGSSHVGSLTSMANLFETLGSFLLHGDRSRRLAGEAIVESAVLVPAPRIVVRVPATAKIEIGNLLASVGRCIAAANGDRAVRLQPHEFDLCLTLAAILGGSGWERLRIASFEDDWESTVHLVPKELRENLSALARAHLKPRSVGTHH